MKFKVKYFSMKVSDSRIHQHLKAPDTVLRYIKHEFEYNESMLLLGMNIKNRVIIKKTIAIGGYNTILIKPADIFIPLLKVNARSFIIVHNHPSGDTSPSQEDITFTKRIDKACQYVGLNLIDHLIIFGNDFYSF